MKRNKSVQARIKTGADLSEGEFVAYPSTFTREPDAYGDVVAKGAFTQTIKDWKTSGHTLPVLYGHDMWDPMNNVASVIDMGEDDHGWWIKGRFDDDPQAQKVYRLVKGGRLNKLSFGFTVEDEGKVTLEDGRKANELRQVKVVEASFVPMPANPDTSVVSVKASNDVDSSVLLKSLHDDMQVVKKALAIRGESVDSGKASGEPPAVSAPSEPALKAHSPSADSLSLILDIESRVFRGKKDCNENQNYR